MTTPTPPDRPVARPAAQPVAQPAARPVARPAARAASRSTAWSAERPTPEQMAVAHLRTLEDVIAPDLRVLFCGINPGLSSAAVGRHFARPGNRFWPALYAAGFTPELFTSLRQDELTGLGLGISSVAPRATVRADELSAEELREGGRILVAKVEKYTPAWVAILGITAYRTAFDRRHAVIGPQEELLAGARVWVLPNPSGLNAHWTAAALGEEFGRLHAAVDASAAAAEIPDGET